MADVFKVPETLAGKYHGSGYALAAVASGQLVDIRYIADVAPDVGEAIAEDDIAGGSHGDFFVRQWIGTTAAGRVVREMQALGEVHVGMLSCWEFITL